MNEKENLNVFEVLDMLEQTNNKLENIAKLINNNAYALERTNNIDDTNQALGLRALEQTILDRQKEYQVILDSLYSLKENN